MKRTLLLLLITCASLANAGDAVKLLFTYDSRFMYQLLDDFMQQQGVEVDAKFVDQSEVRVRLLEYKSKNNLPDMVLVPSDHLGLYKLFNYSEYDPKLSVHSIDERVWQGAASDGTLYGAPFSQGNYLVMYYNKELIEQPAQTWDQLLQQKKLMPVGHQLIDWPYNEMFWFVPFLGAFDGWPFVNGEPSLDSDAMVKALDFYGSLAGTFADPECPYQCVFSKFTEGRLGYTINGDWALNEFKQKLGFRLGVAPIPAIGNLRPTPMFSSYVLAFPGDSLNGGKREQLLELMNYLQSPSVQRQLWTAKGVMPVEQSALKKAISSSSGVQADLLNAVQYTKPMPTESAMSAAWLAMSKAFVRYKSGNMNAIKASEMMQQLTERDIARQQ